ncbi:MAG: hypothetical protein B7X01_02610, partial [Acidiphilium sp. 21-62-4]
MRRMVAAVTVAVVLATSAPTSAAGFSGIVGILGPGMLAAAYALFRAFSDRADRRIFVAWLMLAASILLAVGLTQRMLIFQQIPAGFAAALVPIGLTQITLTNLANPVRAASLRIGLFAVLVFGPYMPAVIKAELHPKKPHQALCSTGGISKLLAPAAGKIVLSNVNYVPQLLYRTQIIAVGSLFQHGISAYLRDRTAWRSPVGATPPPAFQWTGAQFVLFCNTTELNYLGKATRANALWPRLAQNHPPIWLRQIGGTTGQGFRLYRVILPSK